jgi:hypothetical protein
LRLDTKKDDRYNTGKERERKENDNAYSDGSRKEV